MTVAEFKQELETFITSLGQHQDLWRYAQGWPLSVAKRKVLESQANQLARQLGRLRPYILRFLPLPNWIMSVQATGQRWDVLDAAVSIGIPQIKGPSMQAALSKLHQVMGKLDGLSPEMDLGPPPPPKAPAKPAQTQPMSSPGPQTAASDPPPSATPASTPKPPLTWEKMSVGELFAGLGNLSVSALLTLLGILGGLIGVTIAVTRWTDQHAIDAARDSVRVQRDSVRVQQRMLDAERSRADSLAAILRRLPKVPKR